MKYDLSKSADVMKFRLRGKKLIESGAKIELKTVKIPKSIKQNSYAHVVFSLFGVEFGYTLDEVKTLLKQQLGYTYEKNGNTFLMSVADMSTEEVGSMIDTARFLAEQNGCYIPTAEEYLQDKINIDNEIEINHKYLNN